MSMRSGLSCALAVAVLALGACASNQTMSQSRYQMSKTQPDALVNPVAAEAPALPGGPFTKWAAVIVAGDNASSEGGTTEAFDNARRDLATALVGAGFAREHIAQFSSNPKPGDPAPASLANVEAAKGALHRLLGSAGEGCLIYVTSHGNNLGIKFGSKLASPAEIQGLADRTCGIRPTVVILSACHSGVFMQSLQADNRMVMSAARADRSSFGCGTANKYPFFDQCMIQSLSTASNFIALADTVKSCVARTEQAEHFTPPSEPQLSIGASAQAQLAGMRFSQGELAASASVGSQSCTANCDAKLP